MSSNIVAQQYKFYKSNKDWLKKYKDFANNFDTNLVERDIAIRDLNGMLEDCAVLVLTANPVEQNILTYKLYNEVNTNDTKQKLCEIYADDCVYQFATIKNIKIVHVHPNSTSAFPIGGSANAVRNALKRFRPKLVVSLGVAFGIDCEKQPLGDVLISSSIIPYDVFNKDTDGNITLRVEDRFFTHEALNAWNVLLRNSTFHLEKQETKRRNLVKKSLKFRWQFGAMLSGGSVLSNKRKKRSLLQASAKIGANGIIGGEMEGVGIYSECKKPDIPCIVIKGICDWGEEKNSWDKVIEIVNHEQHEEESSHSTQETVTNDFIKDCVQAFAMDNATEALLRLLRFDSNFLDAYSTIPKNNIPSVNKQKKN